MTFRGTTSLLVVLVAVSSAAWNISTTTQMPQLLPWVSVLLALLPHAAAVAAAVLVARARPWWQRAALAYAAAFTALEAVGLVQIVAFASQYETGTVVWSVATSSLALVTTVLLVVVLRQVSAEDVTPAPSLFRWAAVAAGVLLVVSSMFAWTVYSGQESAGRWTFTLSHASTGVLIGSLVGMAVVASITAVVAANSEQSLVAGAMAGLLASRPLTLSLFADSTWQDASAVLAAGWWIALVAQVLLVVALVGSLSRGGRRSRVARDLAPTA